MLHLLKWLAGREKATFCARLLAREIEEADSAFALAMQLRVRWAMGRSVVVAPNCEADAAPLAGGADTRGDAVSTIGSGAATLGSGADTLGDAASTLGSGAATLGGDTGSSGGKTPLFLKW